MLTAFIREESGKKITIFTRNNKYKIKKVED